ncbi:MAG TPA: peptidoglycan DD-metalloendopeptidase family protein [Chloroflexota bacterium]|nr:peptidoglycan DD-metalloendopeptidase family protein [Chloroflexota bacterium]
MLRHGARTLLAGVALCAAAVFSGPASLAQQAGPQAQLDSINAQKGLWQQRLNQARTQISHSSQSLTAAKARLDKTKSSLTSAKAQAAVLQANNPEQIDQLKQDLGSTQSDLNTILKDNTDRQNKLISDLGANQQLIDQTNGHLEATAQQADYTQRRLTELQSEVDRLTQDQAETQQELDVFLRAAYKEQQRSLLEFLLDSVSFGDFLTNVSNLQSVAQQQDHLLSLLGQQQQQLSEVQAEQQAQLRNLQDLQDAQDTEKQTLQLQRQNFDQVLEQARVEAQDASDRLGAREAEVQSAIDQKQGQLSDNQRLLQELRDAQNQLSSTITNQADVLTKAQQQAHVARTQLDQLEREAEGVSAIISQAKPTKTYSSGALAWPMQGAMEQGFGPSPYAFEPSITFGGVRYRHFHTGIDIATAFGTPIRAAADGQVINTGFSSFGYGLHIIISHNPKLATLYAHMSKLAVAQGAVVKQGQIIGYEGSTGNSTGPHLHFEVRVNGEFVNPLSYL